MVKTDAVPKSVASLDVVGCMYSPSDARVGNPLLHSDDSELLPITRHAERASHRLHNTLEGTDGRNASFH